MSYVPHPANEPLLVRPERESKDSQLDDEAARNRTSASEPGGQGSDKPGLLNAPPPGLSADNSAQIKSTGPLSEEARRQLEQNMVPHEKPLMSRPAHPKPQER